MSAPTHELPSVGIDLDGEVRSDGPGRRPRSAGRLLTTVLRWAVLAAAIAFMGRTIVSGWPEITAAVGALSSADAGWLLLVVVIEAAWVVSLAQVYRSSLMAFGATAPHRDALRVSMGAFTLSRVLPGGGAVGALLAAREFVRIGNGGPVTLLALVSAGWVSLVTLTTGLSAGIALGAASGVVPWSMLTVPAVVLGALLTAGTLGFLALRSTRWRRRLFGVIERLFARWAPDMSRDELEAALAAHPGVSLRALAKVGGWSALGWALDATALWAMFSVLGHPLEVGLLSVGYGVANLLQALPEVTPGWLGVLEGSLSLTYAGFGVPLATGVLAVLGYRLVSFWLPVLAGVPSALTILGTHRRTTRKRGDS